MVTQAPRQRLPLQRDSLVGGARADYPQRIALPESGRVPQPDRSIGSGGGQEVAVGGERCSHHSAGVACEDSYLLLDREVPEGDRAARTDSQSLAVRGEG